MRCWPLVEFQTSEKGRPKAVDAHQLGDEEGPPHHAPRPVEVAPGFVKEGLVDKTLEKLDAVVKLVVARDEA